MTCLCCLDSSVDEALPARHAVEEELLGLDARHEPAAGAAVVKHTIGYIYETVSA